MHVACNSNIDSDDEFTFQAGPNLDDRGGLEEEEPHSSSKGVVPVEERNHSCLPTRLLI